MKKIRVGVVGVGYLGQFHAEKYAKMEGVELAGVVDIDPFRAREIARRAHTQPFFQHSELFKRTRVVSIAVPTPLHYPIAKDFLLHGQDVLLEKPICRSLEEADELIHLAESKGLILQVGHLERFNGALSALQGRVHDPLFIESRRLGPFTGRETEINVVLDLMIHDIDIALTLVQSKPRRIQAVGLPVATRLIDVANARIEFDSGCTADLTASRVSDEKTRRTRIFQADGILSIDYLFQKASFSKKSVSGEGGVPRMVTKRIPVERVDLLEREIRAFLKAVRDRDKIPVSGREGRRALEVALQIIQKMGRRKARAGRLNR